MRSARGRAEAYRHPTGLAACSCGLTGSPQQVASEAVAVTCLRGQYALGGT